MGNRSAAHFDFELQHFLEHLIMEINATPTGKDRDLLTDAQIVLLQLQDARSGK